VVNTSPTPVKKVASSLEPESKDMPPEPDAPPDWENYLPGEKSSFTTPTPMDDLLAFEHFETLAERSPAKEEKPVAPPPPAEKTTAPLAGTGPVSSLPPLSIPPIAPPILKEPRDDGFPPRLITIFLRQSGDLDRDRRRIKNVYGILISHPGRDRFQFQVFENGRGHLIDFPNDTTRINVEVLERLRKLMGEETWRVEDITYQ
jgi:hypothetical protein